MTHLLPNQQNTLPVVHSDNQEAYPVHYSELQECWYVLQAGRIVAVYKALIDITGDFKTAIYLSQLLYWQRKGTRLNENDGFIFKSNQGMFEETGLSRKEQERCRKILGFNEDGLCFVQAERKGAGAKLAIRLNMNEIIRNLCAYYGFNHNEQITEENWKMGEHPVLRRMFSECIPYHRDAAYLTDNIDSAIILSMSIGRCVAMQKDFITLTAHDWERLTKIKRKRQFNARKDLQKLGFIKEKHLLAHSSRIFTMPDGKKILKALNKMLSEKEKNKQNQMGSSEMQKGEIRSNQMDISEMQKGEIRSNQMGFSEVTKRDFQNAPNGQHYIVDYNKENYSTNHTPLTPHSSLNVPQGVGVGYDLLFLAEERNRLRKLQNTYFAKKRLPLVIETPKVKTRLPENSVAVSDLRPTNTPLRAEQSGNLNAPQLQQSDFEKFVYPYCLHAKDIRNNVQDFVSDATKTTLFNIVRHKIPQASFDEVQELLDEMNGKLIQSPTAYFRTLCDKKRTGEFIAEIAPEVKARRENKIKPQQQQTRLPEQTTPQQMSQEDLLAAYENKKQLILMQLNSEKMPKKSKEMMIARQISALKNIATEYYKRFNQPISDITDLRLKLIDLFKNSITDELQQIFNSAEFGFNTKTATDE